MRSTFHQCVLHKVALSVKHQKQMSLAIFAQHLFRDFSHTHHQGGKTERKKCILQDTLKKVERSYCVDKMNPKTKKCMKLYTSPKTNSHFITFCLLSGYTGGTRNMGWFVILSLCSLSLTSNSNHWANDFLHHLRSHIFSLLCILFHWPNCTYDAVSVPAVTFPSPTAPVRRVFLLITNMW